MSMVNFINMKNFVRHVSVLLCVIGAFGAFNMSTAVAQTVVFPPPDASVECGGSLSPTALGLATATDGCGAVIDPSDISFADDNAGLNLCGGTTGVIIRTFTASAPAGCGGDATAVQEITITDTTPPVINCPADVPLGVNPPLAGGIPTNLPAPDISSVSAIDGCSAVTVAFLGDSAPTVVNCVATIVRTYEATDQCGNSAQCEQRFTFVLDADGDGICDSEDGCPLVFGDVGSPCDDGDPCSVGETIQTDCTCGGGVAGGVGGYTPLTGSVNTYEGDGGIGPFEYNIFEFDIYGGNLPYLFEWDKEGYVRTSVTYTSIDTDGDGVADTDGAVVTVIYADEADWSVTVTDAGGCGDTGGLITYTNVGNPTQLDIIDYTITADDGTQNGAVDITVQGGDTGCQPYSYTWFYQDGNVVATTEDISGLPYGWYTVVVECADGSESTTGWYYVEADRRGRGKVLDGSQAVKAYPNPFSHVTTIEFTNSISENTNISVYSLDGKLVSELFNGRVEANEIYNVEFNADRLTAGVYIVQLVTESGETKRDKLILVKQ